MHPDRLPAALIRVYIPATGNGGETAPQRLAMKLLWKRMSLGFLALAIFLWNVSALRGQSTANTPPQGAKPPMAEDVFKNVQVLRGIPVDEFMATMGFIAASLSLNCLDCHTQASGRDPAKYAEDTPIKQTARKMLLMVRQINAQNFGG